MKQFDLVRFTHECDGGPVHRVVSIMADGMIEIHDMEGYFAPHLFVIADDVAAIPHDRTPMQRALERDTEIEDLARENERLREALGAVRDLRDEICDLIEDGATIDAPHAVAVKIGNVIDTALGKDRT